MNVTTRKNCERQGMTLVELLVVIVILVMLVGVTVPLVRTVNNGRELQEAMREIETMIDSAKTRAVVTGRPAGVAFVLPPSSDPTAPPPLKWRTNWP
jgi:prepilin-type N-terminal cleavage/methylation domain-containing protein